MFYSSAGGGGRKRPCAQLPPWSVVTSSSQYTRECGSDDARYEATAK